MKKVSELKANECMIIKEYGLITFITHGFSRNFYSVEEAKKEAKAYNLIIISNN